MATHSNMLAWRIPWILVVYIVHRVAKSQTQLTRLHTHTHTHRDFPGGPVAQNPRPTPMQGTWVQSLVRELDLVCHNSEFACCI